jgi:precorrin-2 dehydrogenase
MAFGYPVMLELAGRRCVVVGERAVREGKVEALLEAGADRVAVIAEGPARRLDELAEDRRVSVERRAWTPGDLAGAVLLVGWADDDAERERLAVEARARGVLVNVIDEVRRCDFAAPAVVRRGDLIVAIGTGGASPALAVKLREELQERFGSHWDELVTVLRDVRSEVSAALPDLLERSRRWRAALDLDEAELLVREGRSGELREVLTDRLIGEGSRA